MRAWVIARIRIGKLSAISAGSAISRTIAPSFMMRTRSASRDTTDRFCSTMMLDTLCFMSPRMRKMSSMTIEASPSVGSSISSTRGSPTSARPISSISRCPPDRLPAFLSRNPANFGYRLTSLSTARCSGSPQAYAASSMLSLTVRSANTFLSWLTKRTPCRASDLGGHALNLCTVEIDRAARPAPGIPRWFSAASSCRHHCARPRKPSRPCRG